MLINNEFEVAAPAEKVWQFFENIPQVAACLPGAELTEDLGDDTYKGKVAVRMGPVRLRFAGTADITERDEAAKRVVVHASGADEKGRGQASTVITATLGRTGPGTTTVGVVQDLQLSGPAAQYGRGMITDVTAVLMRDFAANMQGRIERPDLGESAESAAATPANGFSLGLRAALIALSRVLPHVRSFSPAAQQDQAVRANAARAVHQEEALPPPFGWRIMLVSSPGDLGLVSLYGITVAPRAGEPWRDSRMPAVNGVGKPCAGEPHVRLLIGCRIRELPSARSPVAASRSGAMEPRETVLTLSLRQAARVPGSPRGPSGPAGRSWGQPSTIRSTRSL
jgi:carbon monoxide dehydrogenase subunit G